MSEAKHLIACPSDACFNVIGADGQTGRWTDGRLAPPTITHYIAML